MRLKPSVKLEDLCDNKDFSYLIHDQTIMHTLLQMYDLNFIPTNHSISIQFFFATFMQSRDFYGFNMLNYIFCILI